MPDLESQFQRILVATDFSEHAAAALRQAVSLADRTHAELLLVHAVDYRPYAVYGSSFEAPWQVTVAEVQAVENQLRQRSDEQLAEQVAQFRTPERTVRSESLVGVPFVEIILASQRQRSDLVVVGTRGMGGVRRMLVGSTAERLVRKCECPVWVMRSTTAAPPRAILVPVDFSDVSGQSLRLAAVLAQTFGSTLAALHVIGSHDEVVLSPGTTWRDNRQHRSLVKQAAQQHLVDFVTTHVPPEIPCHVQLAVGTPWQKIALAAQHLNADLVVMGSVGRSGIPGFLIGNTAEKVLRHCDRSILTLKPAGFISPIQSES